MTQEQIEELKRLAEAATPGQWSESDGYAGVVAGKQFIAQAYGDRRADCINNAAYIAAANPAAILELIAEVEALRDQVNGLTGTADRAQAEIRAMEDKLAAYARGVAE